MTTQVQNKYLANYGGTGAGVNFALTSAATAGNAICVTLTMATTAVISSVTDSNGVALTLDKAAETVQQANQKIYFYSLPSVSGTPTGINVKLTTDNSIYCYMEEVSGMATASIVDVNPTKATGGYNTTPTMSLTTTTADVYIRALMSYGAARTITPGAGYTANDTASVSRHGVFNVNVGAAGSKTVDATISSAEDWAVSAIGYKTGASGATVSTITGTTVTEASSIVFTTTMSGTGGGTFAYSWSGTATSADYTQTLTNGMFATTGGSGNVTVSGSNITVDSTVTAFTVTVPTTTDTLDEADETVRLVIGGVTASSGTITDDDAAPTITVDDVTESAGSCIFTVSLSAASGKSITVDYATADGTSTAGVDYTAASGTLTFAAGETTKTVTVTVP